MKLVPENLRNTLRKSRGFMNLLSKYRWRVHLLKDWWGTRVWKRTTVVTTPLGFKLTAGFHPAYDQMRIGTFEIGETEAILECLPCVDIFIDVGANLGYYTCLALQHGKHVVAFEPQPQNLRCLFQNLLENNWSDRTEIFPLALGGSPGLLPLYGASGPSASLLRNWAGYSPRFQQMVAVSTLDTVLSGRFMDKRLFIKIDVEGAEAQVLAGSHLTLERSPRPIWLLEVCLHEFHPSGTNPDYRGIFELFFSNGYEAFTTASPRAAVILKDIDRWIEAGRSDSGTFNYLFIHQAARVDDQRSERFSSRQPL